MCTLCDVLAIPDRLEQRIAKAQRKQVLHRVFAQIVVDAVDLLLTEIAVNEIVQCARARQVASERLFDHEPRPARAAIELRAADRLDSGAERLRRQREVEHPPARQAVRALDGADARAERAKSCAALVLEAVEVQAAAAPAMAYARRLEACLGEAGARPFAELRVVHAGAARDAEHVEISGQAAALAQVKQRGQQFAPHEIAGRAEYDEQARRVVLLGGQPVIPCALRARRTHCATTRAACPKKSRDRASAGARSARA